MLFGICINRATSLFLEVNKGRISLSNDTKRGSSKFIASFTYIKILVLSRKNKNIPNLVFMPPNFALLGGSQMSLVNDVDKWSTFYLQSNIYQTIFPLSFRKQNTYSQFFYFGSVYEDVYLLYQQEYTRAMTSWPLFHSLLNSDLDQMSHVIRKPVLAICIRAFWSVPLLFAAWIV